MIFPHSECADLIVGSMINEIKVVALYTGALGFALVTLTDLEKLELACTIFQSALNALENEYSGCIGASSEILAAEEEEGRERGLQMEKSCAEEEERLQAAFYR